VVGTLLWVGSGRLAPEGLDAILDARNRSRAGPNVAPHALYFVEAGYLPWSSERSESAWIERGYV
jgi:tRNA pseudouridine38-40 synthase